MTERGKSKRRQRGQILRIARLAGLLLAGSLLACSVSPAGDAAPAVPSMATAEGRALAVAETLHLINDERARVGLGPFVIDPLLTEVAQLRADEIVETEHYGHFTPDGAVLAYEVMHRLGVYDRALTEALGTSGHDDALLSADTAVTSWLESEGHRRIVLDKAGHLAGIAVAWVGPPGKDFGGNVGTGAIYVLISGTEPLGWLRDWGAGSDGVDPSSFGSAVR